VTAHKRFDLHEGHSVLYAGQMTKRIEVHAANMVKVACSTLRGANGGLWGPIRRLSEEGLKDGFARDYNFLRDSDASFVFEVVEMRCADLSPLRGSRATGWLVSTVQYAVATSAQVPRMSRPGCRVSHSGSDWI
jgi:hypothetical protein